MKLGLFVIPLHIAFLREKALAPGLEQMLVKLSILPEQPCHSPGKDCNQEIGEAKDECGIHSGSFIPRLPKRSSLFKRFAGKIAIKCLQVQKCTSPEDCWTGGHCRFSRIGGTGSL